MNGYRYRGELKERLRRRSGYGQECNPTSTSNGGSTTTATNGGSSSSSSSSASGLPEGYTPISVSGGEEEGGNLPQEEYTEIEIGVVNRFDCDKLLPLYYYELEEVAVPFSSNDNGDVEQLRSAQCRGAIESGRWHLRQYALFILHTTK